MNCWSRWREWTYRPQIAGSPLRQQQYLKEESWWWPSVNSVAETRGLKPNQWLIAVNPSKYVWTKGYSLGLTGPQLQFPCWDSFFHLFIYFNLYILGMSLQEQRLDAKKWRNKWDWNAWYVCLLSLQNMARIFPFSMFKYPDIHPISPALWKFSLLHYSLPPTLWVHRSLWGTWPASHAFFCLVPPGQSHSHFLFQKK